MPFFFYRGMLSLLSAEKNAIRIIFSAQKHSNALPQCTSGGEFEHFHIFLRQLRANFARNLRFWRRKIQFSCFSLPCYPGSHPKSQKPAEKKEISSFFYATPLRNPAVIPIMKSLWKKKRLQQKLNFYWDPKTPFRLPSGTLASASPLVSWQPRQAFHLGWPDSYP